ncbi:ISL3 family transposase [Endozoicomonas sp. G2_2]|nr:MULTISPECIES: ISL3 family transposase [Gammaproteobacteria]MAS10782.1 ISL3 family transposase [Salinisphaera sp.]MBO9471905.1 ISL3 family transposase [Endozoicomonas sp. G2_2]|tara:strand:- start:36 stop:1241 length:1206 start_codon:yes stop_codon:yes gene_type:complete
MPEANLLSLFWEGFSLAHIESATDNALTLRLAPMPTIAPCCSGCGQRTLAIHDVSLRRVRERDLFDRRVWLQVPVRRVRCVDCGIRTESIPWLAGRRRMTAAMVSYVEAMTRLWPIGQVAALLGLHWHTVRAIDHARLRRVVVAPDRSRLRRLMMDEFALYKGHRYATVVACADTQQVLWIGEGRSREAIQPFFEWLGDACPQIEAVAMDMNTAFDLEVRAHCPNALVVYDLFHVIAKYGREVVDRVRVDQANALRHDAPARRVVKRSRWLLLRNRDNLKPDQASALDELLAANVPLMTAYVLKAQLKELWFAPSIKAARARWAQWYAMAMASGIAPLQQFAKRLSAYVEGIIASAVHPMNTSVLEGMNNRIKVIKRQAYGFRNADYFFLKIKAAFPGKVR